MRHVIHLAGGNENRFLTLFQGGCTHCHEFATFVATSASRTFLAGGVARGEKLKELAPTETASVYDGSHQDVEEESWL